MNTKEKEMTANEMVTNKLQEQVKFHFSASYQSKTYQFSRYLEKHTLGYFGSYIYRLEILYGSVVLRAEKKLG